MTAEAVPADRIRLDKWLFFARFFKTRSLAAKVIEAGGVRVNGTRTTKISASVRAGDVLTFAQGRAIRIVEIVETGTRRGPAPEAQALYADRSPPPPPAAPPAPRFDGGGRPTKKDRRALPPRGPDVE
ncbi:ribosome-associated heat shock protein Hsp15 [Palleronia aestuarii]|uniref:Ribosome-associated heat shock protein Hsp15 n=1 Tax=Palleronia aestuarii TaxID=568105 RepID=A0A2W7NH81_9RHOB|nr:RNA-binding S4 domain-containing protein [Palleronia aestuarii]PZX16034.1 ribosome-associated heat shock protein Hsp15 [Palleronia aestuarii]